MSTNKIGKDQRALMDTLAEIGGRLTTEEDVLFQGTKLVIPERMRMQDAVVFLEDKIEEDEREVQFDRSFNYRPWDGAYATLRALKRAFGMVSSKPIQTMFGPKPPELRTINISAHETVQIPWGAITIPLLPGVTLYTGAAHNRDYGLVYQLSAIGPRKYRFEIEGLFRLVEDELVAESIYRGKAFDGQVEPTFLDLRGFDESKVVYSAETMTQLEANVWAVLRYSKQLRELGQPLKRAVLLEGPYGTGKTLAATWTAKIAAENGWTFISCRPGRDDLFTVMQTARLYQPAVVFFEDVDTIADPDSGDDQVSQLLDVFDGIQAKDTRIVVVLTTNHKEQIHKGMLRPGRLDAVIHIGELDADGFKRLSYSIVPDGKLSDDIAWDEVAVAFAGFLPAFVKEALDRAVRYSFVRNGGVLDVLTTEDLVHAANGLRPQLDLMNDAPESGSGSKIESGFKEVVGELLDHTVIHDPGENPDESGYRWELTFKDDLQKQN